MEHSSWLPHAEIGCVYSNTPFLLHSMSENVYTVVPRITTLICSSEIAVELKRCNAKIKSPLKCIEAPSMCSNGLETHRPVKILHRAAIFSACAVRNQSQQTAGSHFIYPVAILKPPISCRKIIVLRRISSRSRERSSQSRFCLLKHRFVIAKVIAKQ